MRRELKDAVWEGYISATEAHAIQRMRDGIPAVVHVDLNAEYLPDAAMSDFKEAVRAVTGAPSVLVMPRGYTIVPQ